MEKAPDGSTVSLLRRAVERKDRAIIDGIIKVFLHILPVLPDSCSSFISCNASLILPLAQGHWIRHWPVSGTARDTARKHLWDFVALGRLGTGITRISLIIRKSGRPQGLLLAGMSSHKYLVKHNLTEQQKAMSWIDHLNTKSRVYRDQIMLSSIRMWTVNIVLTLLMMKFECEVPNRRSRLGMCTLHRVQRPIFSPKELLITICNITWYSFWKYAPKRQHRLGYFDRDAISTWTTLGRGQRYVWRRRMINRHLLSFASGNHISREYTVHVSTVIYASLPSSVLKWVL